MPKIGIAPLIKNVFKNSNIASSINTSHSIRNKGTSLALGAQSSSLVISF